MTQIRTLLIGTALTAFAATAAVAQTTAQPADAMSGQAQVQTQDAQPVTPAPTRLTAPGSNDPLVQKRDANAAANAEYSASKKESKAALKQQKKDAKAQYKQQVRDAKINKKADKQAANNQMKMDMQGQAANQADEAGVKH
jgi:hypothetical protein